MAREILDRFDDWHRVVAEAAHALVPVADNKDDILDAMITNQCAHHRCLRTLRATILLEVGEAPREVEVVVIQRAVVGQLRVQVFLANARVAASRRCH